MKILKAALLTFIILFTINNVNAQEAPSCDGDFSMVVTPATHTLQQSCFSVTVSKLHEFGILYVEAEGNQTIASSSSEFSLTTIVCFDKPSPHIIAPEYLIECGLQKRQGDVTCREGCTVTIDH